VFPHIHATYTSERIIFIVQVIIVASVTAQNAIIKIIHLPNQLELNMSRKAIYVDKNKGLNFQCNFNLLQKIMQGT
jgi:hypothetical protein